jgi:hypothetical protein
LSWNDALRGSAASAAGWLADMAWLLAGGEQGRQYNGRSRALPKMGP